MGWFERAAWLIQLERGRGPLLCRRGDASNPPQFGFEAYADRVRALDRVKFIVALTGREKTRHTKATGLPRQKIKGRSPYAQGSRLPKTKCCAE